MTYNLKWLEFLFVVMYNESDL